MMEMMEVPPRHDLGGFLMEIMSCVKLDVVSY